jgi:nitronate monooxygenase
MNFGGSGKAKGWKDILGRGQGKGVINEVTSKAEYVDKLYKENIAI